jgi:hypothetical protein
MIEVIKLYDDYNKGKMGTKLLFLPKSRHCEERTKDGSIIKLLLPRRAVSNIYMFLPKGAPYKDVRGIILDFLDMEKVVCLIQQSASILLRCQ